MPVLEQYRQQDHTVSCGLDATGEAKTTAPDYDWDDDFRSFMTIFRKVVNECASVAFQRRVVRLQPAQGMSQAPKFSERRQAS